MTKEDAKERWAVIKAFGEGKIIQSARAHTDLWEDEDSFGSPDFGNKNIIYRIKPSPTYRPFANAEECWNEMLKHQPFGWVKNKSDGHYSVIMRVDDDLVINVDDFGMKCVFEHFSFADGSAFGVKVEEK